MSRRETSGPSQRQLRVAEGMRHVLADCLTRGDLHDPRLAGRSLTISEVRISRDLRQATVFVAELGTSLTAEVAEALGRASSYLAGRVSRDMNLKYAPRLRFVADESYDQAAYMEELLARDRARLGRDEGEDGVH